MQIRDTRPCAQRCRTLQKFGAMWLCLLSTSLGSQAAMAEEDDTAALLRRMEELEKKAAQVDTLRQTVSDLQGRVSTLQEQLDRQSAASGDPLSQEQIRQQVEGILLQLESAKESSGYGSGFETTVWGWISYIATPQEQQATFWAWEVELGITKTFSDRLAVAMDVDFVDTNSGARTDIEQLFTSMVLVPDEQTLLTFGKFNSPFGIEPRDFWDQLACTTSLVYHARPNDLVGLMLTQPIGDTGIKARPFIANGFNDDLDINNELSVGLMIEYVLNRDVTFAVTNWYGSQREEGNASELGEDLYFVLVQGTWYITDTLMLQGEFIHGQADDDVGEVEWTGFQALINHDVSETCRIYGRWSYIDNADSYVSRTPDKAHEVSIGFALYLQPHFELRFEYRHDFIDGGTDLDSIGAHATFGF